MDNIKVRNLAKEIILQLDLEKKDSPFKKRVADIIGRIDKFIMPDIFNVNFKDFETEEEVDDGSDTTGGAFFIEGGTEETNYAFLVMNRGSEELKKLNILNEESWPLEESETIIVCFFKIKGEYKWYIAPISLIFKKGEYVTFPHERVAIENLKSFKDKAALDSLSRFIMGFSPDLKRMVAAVSATNTDFKIIEGEDYNYFVNTCFLKMEDSPEIRMRLERKKENSIKIDNSLKDFKNILKI